jgi:hypothetical protein
MSRLMAALNNSSDLDAADYPTMAGGVDVLGSSMTLTTPQAHAHTHLLLHT